MRRKPNIFDSPLANHFEILAYDQRGLGQTDRPDVLYTMEDYANDANSLLELVGWDHCFVMGVSFGGMVGQELGLRYPQRVERLVLACSSSGGAGGASYPLHEFSELSPQERALRGVLLADTRLDRAWQAANPQELQELVDQNLLASALGQDEPGRQVGARRQIEARKMHDTYDRLPNLRMPVFVCGGKYDDVAPIVNQEALQKQIPRARLELFEGGHAFHRQDPRAPKRIRAFFQGELDD